MEPVSRGRNRSTTTLAEEGSAGLDQVCGFRAEAAKAMEGDGHWTGEARMDEKETGVDEEARRAPGHSCADHNCEAQGGKEQQRREYDYPRL